ncbi:MAG: hypothetical protein K6E32_00055 [Lachnospiraceae bacterium]|nr:hypothetical protein [Lachnospiraceae bacterium]
MIDDEHADFLFEASDGSLSEAEYLENIWLYFSGDYSRYVLEMLTDPKDGQENAFMYDSLENVAVGEITIDKMENGIILHADMSAAGSWEGVSFSNLNFFKLRYRMSTGEEYSRLIELSESSNPEGFNDADTCTKKNRENKTEYDDLVYRECSHGYEIESGCNLRVDKETLTKVCEHPRYVVICVNGDEICKIAIDEEKIEYQTIKRGNYEIYLVDEEDNYYDILTAITVFEPAGSLMMMDE